MAKATVPEISFTSPVGRRVFFCAIAGCQSKCDRASARAMFCDPCWVMCPSDIKALVERAWRPEHYDLRKWTARFEKAMEWACQEILSVKLSGHRIPKEQDFQW